MALFFFNIDVQWLIKWQIKKTTEQKALGLASKMIMIKKQPRFEREPARTCCKGERSRRQISGGLALTQVIKKHKINQESIGNIKKIRKKRKELNSLLSCWCCFFRSSWLFSRCLFYHSNSSF